MTIDWSKVPLGKASDVAIARSLGVSDWRVYAARTRLGIPRYSPADRCECGQEKPRAQVGCDRCRQLETGRCSVAGAPHGTSTRYNLGCKCDGCKEAEALRAFRGRP